MRQPAVRNVFLPIGSSRSAASGKGRLDFPGFSVALRGQVDWKQVGALARAGSPVFFRDKSPNVEKMARTGGTKYSFLQMI